MRKVFRNALIIALSGAMLGGLYSCKDTDEDLRNDLETEFTKQLQTLRDEHASLKAALEAQIQAVESELNGKISTLNSSITTLTNNYNELKAIVDKIKSCTCDMQAVSDLQKAVKDLQDAIGSADNGTGLAGQIDALQKEIDSLKNVENPSAADITRLDSLIVELRKEIANCVGQSELTKYATIDVVNELKDSLGATNDKVAEILTSLNNFVTKDELQTVADDLQKLSDKLSDLEAGLSDQIKSLINEALTNYATTTALADSTSKLRAEAKENLEKVESTLRQEIEQAVKDLKGNYDGTLGDLNDAFQAADKALQDQIDALKTSVEQNTNDIAVLKKSIEAIENKLAKLVTSVIVQGTYNPAFGSIALPLNVRSNVLCAYVGEAGSKVEFPSIKTSNLVNADQAFTDADFEILGNVSTTQLEDGETIVDDSEGNAGKLYVTVNPTSVDFTGLDFKLVNSLDEETGITLSAPVPSTDKLTFGFTGTTATRGDASNGFYEMYANVDANKVNNIRLTLNSSLKSALKDLYKNRTNANFTNLALTIYKQFDGILDANAVKSSWTNDDNTTNSVYSQYSVAAFSYQPLSYAFDPSLSYKFSKIPDIPSLGDINFNFTIKTLDFNFDLSGLNLNFDIDTDLNIDLVNENYVVTVYVDMPIWKKIVVNGVTTVVAETDDDGNIKYDKVPVEINLSDIVGSLSKELAEALSAKLKLIMGDLTEQIKTQLITQLAEQIESQVATTLTNTINGLLADLSGQINSQIGSYVSKYSSYLSKLQTLVNRVNSIIERLNNGININHYLQPALVYTTGDGSYNLVSGVKTSPTLFKLDGGNAIILQPTSLSAELIAPAYKKFVGVTNVISNSDSSKTAQDGDADCKAAASKANSQSYIDEVISGSRYGVPFVGESGYTYEIAYAALDYHGKCAIRKFYIKVL